MKACWDNLNELRYNKKTGKWYKDKYRNGKRYTITTYSYNEDGCAFCGKPFFYNPDNKGVCCSLNCNAKLRNSMYKMSEKTKRKIGKANYKGGYYKKKLVYYDTYASQLEWCEEVKRNNQDPNILEVKCFKCDKWFVPSLSAVGSRIKALKGQLDGHCRLYCSDICKNMCSVFNKSTDFVMKRDSIKSGNMSWMDLDREMQPELRQIVLERDEYQCVKCGSDENLQCHHIIPVSIDPIESADVDNCITLCYNCHKKVHEKDGCRYSQLKIEIC